jgi:hypothetical protein
MCTFYELKVQNACNQSIFRKTDYYKQVLDFHRPSQNFMTDIWASKSLVPPTVQVLVGMPKWLTNIRAVERQLGQINTGTGHSCRQLVLFEPRLQAGSLRWR